MRVRHLARAGAAYWLSWLLVGGVILVAGAALAALIELAACLVGAI
jgi:hypothetical protein